MSVNVVISFKDKLLHLNNEILNCFLVLAKLEQRSFCDVLESGRSECLIKLGLECIKGQYFQETLHHIKVHEVSCCITTFHIQEDDKDLLPISWFGVKSS